MSRVPGSRIIAFATRLLALLALLDAGLMYIRFGAQYRFKLTSLALRRSAREDDDQPAY